MGHLIGVAGGRRTSGCKSTISTEPFNWQIMYHWVIVEDLIEDVIRNQREGVVRFSGCTKIVCTYPISFDLTTLPEHTAAWNLQILEAYLKLSFVVVKHYNTSLQSRIL